jgi:hypothetical protein
MSMPTTGGQIVLQTCCLLKRSIEALPRIVCAGSLQRNAAPIDHYIDSPALAIAALKASL